MVVILFGVTGSGKTTVGSLLSATLDWKFYDADDFHPKANVEKMRQGIPLTDEDRTPWLASLRERIQKSLDEGEHAVLACSALKETYRQYLHISEDVKFVHLKGSFDLIRDRLSKRIGHYMNPGLLQSQFNTLEEPKTPVFVANIGKSPAEIVEDIIQYIKPI
ncbi:gluconokinase [Rhodocytophaga aerolata]|uniref:Gluconokinase n=1 Tax=Rhodocytophaga aerolata TaxID=455078 RepID=A0ABT8R2S9_9BACT|nr:gluconokinase [Rhodocytophaga aerolata]MDO1445583.1 gluconokinase [Rhodocytophaga aerolata]